jgi:hypothetical protein
MELIIASFNILFCKLMLNKEHFVPYRSPMVEFWNNTFGGGGVEDRNRNIHE